MPPKPSGGKTSKTPTSSTPVAASSDEAQQQSQSDNKLVQLRLNTQDFKFKNAPPRGRAFTSVCCEDSRIVMFGGWDGAVPPTAEARCPLPTMEFCLPLSEWAPLAQSAHVAVASPPMVTSLTSSVRSLTATLPSPASQARQPNEHPASTQCASAELNGNLYVHGGWTGSSRSNVLSCLDLLENSWETVRLSSGATSIPPLTFHSMSGVGKRLYIYGGNQDGAVDATSGAVQQSLSDVMYAVDLSSASSNNGGGGGECSVSVCGQHGAPPRRSSHTATVFMDTYIVVFGGRGGADGASVLGDVAIFDTTSATWMLHVPVENSPAVPPPRYCHAACRVEGKGVLIHGGIGQDGNLLNDAWLMSMEKPGVVQWKRVLSEGTLLTARCGHAMVNMLGNTHHVMVLGGKHSLPNTLVDTTPAQPTSPTGGGGTFAAGGKTSGRVSPPMSNNSSTAPSKRPTKPSAAALAAAAAEAQAALLAAGPLDYVLLEFPEFRPAGLKTPSNASLQGGGHRESISSKVTSIRPHQPQ